MPLPLRQREAGRRPMQRVEPFRELTELQQMTMRLMQDALGDQVAPDGMITPLVDIEETDKEWILEAELPGVRREDINLEINGSELVITGEIKERERKGILRRRTRPVGRFEFRAQLPGLENSDPDKIDASVENGVLTVRVPKADTERRRRIEVHQ
jgi:HSP20 family protein